ncbi:CMP-N-acetylneuraminate-beta-galactosamide-alpha-2,3-sialyltransferase 4-like [Protopterus annectens]|uniref:CMP-N-acetylneuraminate-beta-galactosamide- alpha-2,3-sialyltransferase 4-like n=1 Tax=Protopterus annectens TaxID=7888 RepID=UPI001CFB9F0F|nr:CMP-N-acetylneuraminate-beta-galactosamide-alpha-2,3-sialyltransferase 4-like [Protopterus annectens]
MTVHSCQSVVQKYLSHRDLCLGLKSWRNTAAQSELSLLHVFRKAYVSDIQENISRLKCKTCVVIGNGYSVINSSLGELINQHDVVIRINNGPVKGYEKDVGTKTTIRLFYPESAEFDPADEDPEALLVLMTFKKRDLEWLKQNLYDEKRNRNGFWKLPPLIWNVDPSRVRILNPYFMHVANMMLLQPTIKATPNAKKGTYPTTGLLAVTVALHFCDIVHLAGFGYPHANETQVPVHYFEKGSVRVMSDAPHSIDVERAILQKLSDLGALKFLKGYR